MAGERTEHIGLVRSGGIRDDHALAAAQRQAGDGVLIAHAAGESQHIGERLLLSGVRVHPAPAGGRSQRTIVHSDDRSQTGAGIVAEDDLLVVVEFWMIEEIHEGSFGS